MTGRRLMMAARGAILLELGGLVWTAPAADDNGCDLKGVQKVPWCAVCTMFVEKDDVEKGAHKTCQTKVTQIDACVKTAYQCPTCPRNSRTPGKCKDCKKDLDPRVSKAKIVYHCNTCAAVTATPGKCKTPNCKGTMVESCELSGQFPHTKTDPTDPGQPAGKRPKSR